MAERVIKSKVDDLDPTLEADQTIDFGLDGVTYEIDLTDENADRLREILAEFISPARRLGPMGSATRKSSEHTRRLTRDEGRDVRIWIRTHGGTVADRGRIPEHYLKAYFENNLSVFGVF